MTDARPAPGLGRVLANLGHLASGKAAAGLMSLAYLVIVARTLGARDYGVLVLVNGYVLFTGGVLAFSGFHGVVRYGAIALAAGDRPRLARIVRLMTLVELGCGIAAAAATALAVPLIGPRLGWTADAMRIAPLYALAVFATVRATPQGLLQLDGRYDRIGLQQVVSPAVRLAGSLLAWAAGGGLDAFLLVWLVSSLAEGASMWLLARPSWRRLAGERMRGPWRGVARADGFARFAIVTNLDITLRELAGNLAPLTIGWIAGPAAAGLYALAQRATNALGQPATLIGQASYSVLADLAARGRRDLLRATVWRSAALAAGGGALFVAAVALLPGLLPLIGGRSFAGGAALVVLVAGGRAAALAAAPVIAGLTALGRPGRSMTANLVAGLLLYPALPALLIGVGLIGAGWHALATGIVGAALLAHAFARDSA